MALLTNINGKFSVSDAGAVTFNDAFTFPTADGTANYVLKTNGSGQLAWAADNYENYDYWILQGDSAANVNINSTNTLKFVGGTYIDTSATWAGGSNARKLTINHETTSRTDTTSTDAPAFGGTFEAVTSVTTNTTGHITAIDVSTITIPTEDGIVTGSGTLNKVARWTATGSDIGDGPITFATNDSTFAGSVTITGNLFLPTASSYIKLGGYSYIGEDLTEQDSLTIASDSTESIYFAHYNQGTSTYTTTVQIDSSGNVMLDVNNWLQGHVTVGGGTQNLIRSRAMGYPGYYGCQIGQETNHIALFIDPNSVAGGAFSGNVNELMLPNKVIFQQANAVTNPTDWLNGQSITLDNGKVGIGTDSPGYKLQVQGTGYYSSQLTVDGFTNNAGISFRTGIAITNVGIRAKAVGTTNRDGLELLGYNGIDFTVNNGANVAIRIVGVTGSGMGNVGIGTTSPTEHLTISGGAANTNPGTVEAPYIGEELAFKIENPGWSSTNGLIRMIQPAGAYVNNATMTFSTLQGSLTEKMRITNAGNVGIGTTTPGRKLTVAGDVAGDANNLLLSNENDTDGDSASIGFSMLSNNTYVKAGVFFKRTTTQGRGDLIFATNNEVNGNNVTSSNARLTIKNSARIEMAADVTMSGSVGIGETTLQRKFNLYDGTDTWTRVQCGASTADWLHGIAGSDHTYKWYNQSSNGGVGYKMALATSGALTVSNDVVAYGSPSDARLKENIKPIESALDKVSKLQGVTFDWKESDSILDIKEDIGFIAQDVQKVIPELVRENEDGMLSMRHQGVAPILLEAIKELKAEIEELKLNNCNCNK